MKAPQPGLEPGWQSNYGIISPDLEGLSVIAGC
jgi:hypothetical protein